ncbi:hypothetical protein ACTA71_001646 [Dictyostelium dimigraforme]
MSFIQYKILLIIISLISISFGQLPFEQKESIDILLYSFNLQPISNDNYCGSPQYFTCDAKNDTIEKINLSGGLNIKIIFPNGTIDKFINLRDISLKNTVLSNLFFDEISPSLKNLDFDNCSIPSFPENLKSINSLYFNDVDFNGDISSWPISHLYNFKLTYSSIDKIKNYQFLPSNETQTYYPVSEHLITVNNIVYSPYTTYNNLTYVLGKYFNQESLNEIGNTTIRELKIVDIGYFNKQITIPIGIPTETVSFTFSNLQFNTTDYEYLNFTNTKALNLVLYNCSGLLDSNNDLKIIQDSLKYFAAQYSNLKKIPSFYKDLVVIDVSNNQIMGDLPDLIEPEKIDQVMDINLSNNHFHGTIPPNYCFHQIIIANNDLNGDIPMCFICHLNDPNIRKRLNGNNFNNYISGSINGFPSCSGIKFTSNAVFSAGFGEIKPNGINFGWPLTNYTENSIVSTPNLLITVSIPNKQINIFGYSNSFWEKLEKTNFTVNVLFKVPNLNATLKFDVLPPTFSDVLVSPYSNLGYSFYIIGQGVATAGYNSNVTVDNFECSVLYRSNGIINCVVYQPQMPEKIYKIAVFNNQTKLTGFYQYKFERIYPFIFSVIPSTIQGGIVSLYGNYGSNTTFISISIGDQICQNITWIDPSLIQCTIGPGVGVHSINLTVNGVNWIGKNIYTFILETPICPGKNKQCNGNGDCINGGCYCFKGFGGILCSNVLETSIDIKGNDTLTEMIKNGYSFGFSIKDIREVDISEKVVRQHNFTKWTLTPDSTINKWTYINKFGNSIISYTIEQIIDETRNYTFAGELITLQPGSIKLSANISNWEYLGSLNTLKLQIQSSVKAQEENECEKTSEIQSNSNGFSLNYITIQKDKNIFSGRFIDKVVSDGRPTFSKVSVSEQTEDSITVSISLPYCKECLIDPDFSVMINPDITLNNCNNDRSSKLKWILPVSIILGLLGLFSVFVLVFFLARDRIYVSKKGGIIILKKIKKTPAIKE